MRNYREDPDLKGPDVTLWRPLQDLLVVAGVRGAGKTTFLRALAAGRLDPALLARISRSASHWPQVEGSDHADWMPLVATGALPIPHLTLHWDLVNFHHDIGAPALKVLQMADRVTVVNVRPGIPLLTAQFDDRSRLSVALLAAGQEPPTEIWDHLPRPLIGPKFAGVPGGKAQVRHLEELRRTIVAHYGDADWLARLYADWDATVAELAEGAILRVLEVEPTDDGGGHDSTWRVTRDSCEA